MNTQQFSEDMTTRDIFDDLLRRYPFLADWGPVVTAAGLLLLLLRLYYLTWVDRVEAARILNLMRVASPLPPRTALATGISFASGKPLIMVTLGEQSFFVDMSPEMLTQFITLRTVAYNNGMQMNSPNVKEMSVPGSTYLPTKTPLACSMAVRLYETAPDGQVYPSVIGWATRISTNYFIIPSHVLTRIVRETLQGNDVSLVSSVGDKNRELFRKDFNFLSLPFSRSADLDYAMFRLPGSVWCNLACKNARVASMKTKGVSIIGYDELGRLAKAAGVVRGPSAENLFCYEHTASTQPGTSGAPVSDQFGHVLGIHLGVYNSKNYFLSLPHVLRYVLKQETSEAPEDWILDFDENKATEEYEAAKEARADRDASDKTAQIIAADGSVLTIQHKGHKYTVTDSSGSIKGESWADMTDDDLYEQLEAEERRLDEIDAANVAVHAPGGVLGGGSLRKWETTTDHFAEVTRITKEMIDTVEEGLKEQGPALVQSERLGISPSTRVKTPSVQPQPLVVSSTLAPPKQAASVTTDPPRNSLPAQSKPVVSFQNSVSTTTPLAGAVLRSPPSSTISPQSSQRRNLPPRSSLMPKSESSASVTQPLVEINSLNKAELASLIAASRLRLRNLGSTVPQVTHGR